MHFLEWKHKIFPLKVCWSIVRKLCMWLRCIQTKYSFTQSQWAASIEPQMDADNFSYPGLRQLLNCPWRKKMSQICLTPNNWVNIVNCRVGFVRLECANSNVIDMNVLIAKQSMDGFKPIGTPADRGNEQTWNF